MRGGRLAATLLCLLLLTGCAGAGEKEYTDAFFAMDTVMELTAYGADGQGAVDEARALIEKLEGLVSVTDESSEIAAANRGEAVTLSPETAELLETALEVCASTEGALDVTVYPVVRAWGFTTGDYQVPDEDAIAALLDRVDYTQVQPRDGVLALPEGVELDLGAVAKGYAGDRVMDLFRDRGVVSAMITLGGNVQVLGGKPDGSPWRVAVQAPEGEQYVGVVEVKDRAVITSGGYERYFERDGARYWHIMDPATGRPADSGLVSVTIVSESGVWADGLSTALFVMGRDRAAEYWRERQGAFDFILIDENGGVTISEGLADSFSLTEDWAGHTLEVVRR